MMNDLMLPVHFGVLPIHVKVCNWMEAGTRTKNGEIAELDNRRAYHPILD